MQQLNTVDFFYHEELDSTNSEAFRKLEDPNAPHFFAVMAGMQTLGRGRRGSTWQSQNGNLHLTLAYKIDSADQQSVLDHAAFLPLFAAALSSEVIYQRFNLRPRIKWPNDLVYNGKKLAGHLIETQAQGHNITKLVIGIGINLNLIPTLSDDFAATSLTDLLQTSFSNQEILDFGQAIFAYYKKIDFLGRINKPEFFAKLNQLYLDNKLAHGQLWSLQTDSDRLFLQQQDQLHHSALYLRDLEISDNAPDKAVIEVNSSFHSYKLAFMQNAAQKSLPLLMLDVGNTRSKFFLLENAWNFDPDKAKTINIVNNDIFTCENDLGEKLLLLMRHSNQTTTDKQQIPIYFSSVNPTSLSQIKAALPEKKFILIEVEKKPLHYRHSNYAFEQLGADRFFMIEAALAKVPRKQRFLAQAESLIVIFSFGTALTVDFVTQNGAHQGGYIVPGLQGSLTALSEKTARLPKLKMAEMTELSSPSFSKNALPFGSNTESALLRGQYNLYQSFVMTCLNQAFNNFPELALQVYCCGGDAIHMQSFFAGLKQNFKTSSEISSRADLSSRCTVTFDEHLIFAGLRAVFLGGDEAST